MRILAIETSCDETAVAVLEAHSTSSGQAKGGFDNPKFKLLGNALLSQVDIHKEFGGVYPTLAKREHGKNLIPLLQKAMEEAGLYKKKKTEKKHSDILKNVRMFLRREPELLGQFEKVIPEVEKPNIDYIAVTRGPGLEPTLWVGINFAKALSLMWNIPLIPVNHMEGHILSVLYDGEEKIEFPALALLISGGHTELVLMKDPLQYEKIGETQDDAVGEAFDKVARMLGLPYPGGPEISRLAKQARNKSEIRSSKDETNSKNEIQNIKLPRPMLEADNCHFSFSGLKTAVLYAVKDLELDEKTKQKVAREFEDAVVEVLLKKTKRALRETGAKTLIIGGGVIANTEIRKAFRKFEEEENIKVLIPKQELTTDNAVMIGIAGYFRALENPEGENLENVKANGNLSIEEEIS